MKDDFFVLLSGSRLSLQYLHDDDDEAVRALIYCTENEISDIVVLSSVQFFPDRRHLQYKIKNEKILSFSSASCQAS